MTQDAISDPGTEAPLSASDLARYAAAAAAADDPELVLSPATRAFSDMYKALCAVDRSTANGAALIVQDLCLQACAAPAASTRSAEDLRRFLKIMIGWAWPRVPAVAAILEASRECEMRRWGGEVSGAA